MRSNWRPDIIRIITLDGRIFKKYDLNIIGNTAINISDLPTGMYYLVLDDTKHYKIVKY